MCGDIFKEVIPAYHEEFLYQIAKLDLAFP